jgi:DHA1 family multidrug resistance protein-like MFS transporter
LPRGRLSPHSIICLIGFSSAAASSIIAPVFAIFVRDAAAASLPVVGLATAIFFAVSAVARFSLGVFAGGKKTITYVFFAFLVFTVCHVFYPYTQDVAVIVGLRAAQGFASASIGVASLTLAGLAIPVPARNKAMGTYTAWISVGLLAGPLINLVAIPLIGISNSFLVAGSVAMIGCSAAFVLYRRFSAIERRWQIVEVPIQREAVGAKMAAIITNNPFVVALVANFTFFFFFGVLLAYAPLYMKEHLGFSDVSVSLLFFAYYATTTLTRLLAGRIAGRVDRVRVILLCIVLTMLFSSLLAAISNSFAFALIFTLVGGIQGVLFPVASTLIAESIQPSRIAFANSLYVVGFDLGQATAPLLTATIVAAYGIQYGFAFSAGLTAALLPLLAWLSHHR